MPSVREVAVAYYRQQQTAVRLTASAIERAWSALDRANLSQSYVTSVGPAMVSILTAGQQVAASTAQTYVAAAVDAQGATADAAGAVSPPAFAGTSANGRTLASLLYMPVIGAKVDMAGGASLDTAMDSALSQLLTIVDTEVGDAGRNALSTAMTSDRKVHGYVRMVSGSACSRCIILAGRHYRYNASFQRHPKCACVGVPSVENLPHFTTDPNMFFDHLSKAEQDARFGVHDAEAIRQGADIFQVVNARRSVYDVGVFGRTVQATHEGVTKRGIAGKSMRSSLLPGQVKGPRLTPTEIFKQAGDDRDMAISLLKKYAYIL